MIGSLPMVALTPLDYRAALDGAAAELAHCSPLTICAVPALCNEAAQRFAATAPYTGALWVEPLAASWQAELVRLSVELPVGAPLAIVASLPFARMIPERTRWPGAPLAMQVGGVWRLRRALKRSGWQLRAEHGFHTTNATMLNMVANQCSRFGRPDLADRFGFAARLQYRTTGVGAALATVALLIARKEQQL